MPAPSTDSAAARQVIRALIADGWGLTHVWDGEEEVFVTTEQTAMEALFAVDMAHLHVSRGSERGWVWFVWGNAPDEAPADYTINLSDTLDPLTEEWYRDA